LVQSGNIQKAPTGKPKVKGNLWHWLPTKTDNITHFNDYGRFQIQFCISLHKLFSNNLSSSCPPDAQKKKKKKANTGQVMFSGEIYYYWP